MGKKQIQVIVTGRLSDKEKESINRIYSSLVQNDMNKMKLTKKQRRQVAEEMKQHL